MDCGEAKQVPRVYKPANISIAKVEATVAGRGIVKA